MVVSDVVSMVVRLDLNSGLTGGGINLSRENGGMKLAMAFILYLSNVMYCLLNLHLQMCIDGDCGASKLTP